jgi:hypothetical protein
MQSTLFSFASCFFRDLSKLRHLKIVLVPLASLCGTDNTVAYRLVVLVPSRALFYSR